MDLLHLVEKPALNGGSTQPLDDLLEKFKNGLDVSVWSLKTGLRFNLSALGQKRAPVGRDHRFREEDRRHEGTLEETARVYRLIAGY